jgi:hypothetical protein
MPMRVRNWRTWSLTRPEDCTGLPKASTTPAPGSILTRPVIARSKVDLPEPEGPIKATISPRATLTETPSSARRAP